MSDVGWAVHRASFVAVVCAVLLIQPAAALAGTPTTAATVGAALTGDAPIGRPADAVIAPPGAAVVETAAAEPEVTGQTALMRAAGDGQVESVQALLSGGVDITAVDSRGWSAVMYAAWAGHAAVVKILLAKGAAVDGRDSSGATPLLRGGHRASGDRRSAARRRCRRQRARSRWRHTAPARGDDAELRNSLGAALGMQGNLAAALEQFEQALALRPDFADARGNLAQARAALDARANSVTSDR